MTYKGHLKSDAIICGKRLQLLRALPSMRATKHVSVPPDCACCCCCCEVPPAAERGTGRQRGVAVRLWKDRISAARAATSPSSRISCGLGDDGSVPQGIVVASGPGSGGGWGCRPPHGRHCTGPQCMRCWSTGDTLRSECASTCRAVVTSFA